MTLLELLRQELPKRGGWPKGVNRINQGWDGRLEKYGEDGESYDFGIETIFPLSTDHRVKSKRVHECGANFVTREQYGYDGTGLPPVGVECEVLFTDDGFYHWYDFKLIFIGDIHAVAIVGDEEISYTIERLNDSSVQFRPLRTEAERAIDEMVRLSGVSIGAAKILYDAGYRKG